jgi:hypothetical protein
MASWVEQCIKIICLRFSPKIELLSDSSNSVRQSSAVTSLQTTDLTDEFSDFLRVLFREDSTMTPSS